MLQIVLDLARPFVWGIARLYFRVRFEGVEHVPRTGPLLIVANHVSYADPVLITIPIRRPIHYLAWDRFFRIPVFGLLIRGLRAFPVNLDEPDPQAVRTIIRLLRAGAAVLIFPEGGRSPDGGVQPLDDGAVRLALRLKVPVCLVSIAGAFEAWPLHRRLPRPGRVRIRFHPPFVPRLRDETGDPDEEVRHLAENLREKLAKGQEFLQCEAWNPWARGDTGGPSGGDPAGSRLQGLRPGILPGPWYDPDRLPSQASS